MVLNVSQPRLFSMLLSMQACGVLVLWASSVSAWPSPSKTLTAVAVEDNSAPVYLRSDVASTSSASSSSSDSEEEEVRIIAVTNKMENLPPTDNAINLYKKYYSGEKHHLLTIFEFDRTEEHATVGRLGLDGAAICLEQVIDNIGAHLRRHVMTVCGHPDELLSVGRAVTALGEEFDTENPGGCDTLMDSQQPVCHEASDTSGKIVMQVPVRLLIKGQEVVVWALGLGLSPKETRLEDQANCLFMELEKTKLVTQQCTSKAIAFMMGDTNTRFVISDTMAKYVHVLTEDDDEELLEETYAVLNDAGRKWIGEMSMEELRAEILPLSGLSYEGKLWCSDPMHSGAKCTPDGYYKATPEREQLFETFKMNTEWWGTEAGAQAPMQPFTYKNTPYALTCAMAEEQGKPYSKAFGIGDVDYQDDQDCLNAAIVVGEEGIADKPPPVPAATYPEGGRGLYFGMDSLSTFDENQAIVRIDRNNGVATFAQLGWLDCVGIAKDPFWNHLAPDFELFETDTAFVAYDHLLVRSVVKFKV